VNVDTSYHRQYREQKTASMASQPTNKYFYDGSRIYDDDQMMLTYLSNLKTFL